MNAQTTWTKNIPHETGQYWFHGWIDVAGLGRAEICESETNLLTICRVNHTTLVFRNEQAIPLRSLKGVWTKCIVPIPTPQDMEQLQ